MEAKMKTKRQKMEEGATTNGTSAPKRPPPFQNQPQLTEKEFDQMKIWLDTANKPLFTVKTWKEPSDDAKNSKKRKREDAPDEEDLWDDRLVCKYSIHPKDKWEKLRRYRKFTVGSESIATGECVMVKHDDEELDEFDQHAQWKGKVLEVRALDTEHVFVRLAWLNRPEDLSKGRVDYHGQNELIPTNQMDIVDALSINGSVQVVHWDDNGDESNQVGDDEFFWRQTYDFNSKSFSKLKLICTDGKPQNPDEMILQCSAESCRLWMHVGCIATEAARQAAGEKPKNPKTKLAALPDQPAPPKNEVRGDGSAAVAYAKAKKYQADVFIKGLADADSVPPAKVNEVVITKPSGEKYGLELRCLHCTEVVDD